MSSKITSHIRLHPCWSIKDFESINDSNGYSIKYSHSFIPDQANIIWPIDFRLHICYIPSTFDVCCVISGSLPNGEYMNSVGNIIKQFETAQNFPDGFVNVEKFKELLCSVELHLPRVERIVGFIERHFVEDFDGLNDTNKRYKTEISTKNREQLKCPYVAIPGSIISKIDYDFQDYTGEKNFFLLELGCLPVTNEKKGFATVHRRIEWFMHFYLNRFNPIDNDQKYKVFFAIRMRLKNYPQFNDFENEQIVNKIHETNLVDNIIEVKTFDNHIIDEILLNPVQPIEIMGIVTAFQFFALPKDKIRITQFFLMPNYQKRGIGPLILKNLLDYICLADKIKSISIEDPSENFKRIYDLVTIKRAIQAKIFDNNCVNYRINDDNQTPLTDLENWYEHREVLANTLLINPSQILRLKWIFIMASKLPDNLNLSNDLAAINLFISNTHSLKDLRKKVKKKIFKDNLEWFTQPGADLRRNQSDLEREWILIAQSLINSVLYIRRNL